MTLLLMGLVACLQVMKAMEVTRNSHDDYDVFNVACLISKLEGDYDELWRGVSKLEDDLRSLPRLATCAGKQDRDAWKEKFQTLLAECERLEESREAIDAVIDDKQHVLNDLDLGTDTFSVRKYRQNLYTQRSKLENQDNSIQSYLVRHKADYDADSRALWEIYNRWRKATEKHIAAKEKAFIYEKAVRELEYMLIPATNTAPAYRYNPETNKRLLSDPIYENFIAVAEDMREEVLQCVNEYQQHGAHGISEAKEQKVFERHQQLLEANKSSKSEERQAQNELSNSIRQTRGEEVGEAAGRQPTNMPLTSCAEQHQQTPVGHQPQVSSEVSQISCQQEQVPQIGTGVDIHTRIRLRVWQKAYEQYEKARAKAEATIGGKIPDDLYKACQSAQEDYERALRAQQPSIAHGTPQETERRKDTPKDTQLTQVDVEQSKPQHNEAAMAEPQQRAYPKSSQRITPTLTSIPEEDAESSSQICTSSTCTSTPSNCETTGSSKPDDEGWKTVGKPRRRPQRDQTPESPKSPADIQLKREQWKADYEQCRNGKPTLYGSSNAASNEMSTEAANALKHKQNMDGIRIPPNAAYKPKTKKSMRYLVMPRLAG